MGPEVDSEMAIMLARSWLVNQPVRCPCLGGRGWWPGPAHGEQAGAEKLRKQPQVEHHEFHPSPA